MDVWCARVPIMIAIGLGLYSCALVQIRVHTKKHGKI